MRALKVVNAKSSPLRLAAAMLLAGIASGCSSDVTRFDGLFASKPDTLTTASVPHKNNAVNGKLPRCILIIHIETIYFHCAKAIVRSKLWEEATKIDRKSLPSTGTIIAELSKGKLGGETYDREAPERIKAQLY